MSKKDLPKNWHQLLAICVLIGLIGAVYPVLFQGGSPLAEYFSKQIHLELVHEQAVESYMEDTLFGEGEPSLDDYQETLSEDERNTIAGNHFPLDKGVALMLLLCSFLLIFPKFRKTALCHSLLFISLWILMQSIATSLNGGKKFSELAVLAHATRWVMPLVLWGALWQLKAGKRRQVFEKYIIIIALASCSVTFAVHGWEAFCQNPPFQDLLYNTFSIVGWNMSPQSNAYILKTVACMDIALAVLLLILQRPGIFLWLAFWGAITALSRITAIGLEAWPQSAVRIANGALPFILFYVYKNSKPHNREKISEQH